MGVRGARGRRWCEPIRRVEYVGKEVEREQRK